MMHAYWLLQTIDTLADRNNLGYEIEYAKNS